MDIIYNSLKSSDLDVIALSSPDRVTGITASQISVQQSPVVLEKLVSNVALQINTARQAFAPAFKAIDLDRMIADVIVETSAQGASLLEVHVIDPYWALLRRTKEGWCFIDVDPDGSGFLWPPIEINFPPKVSDATWRLVQIKPSTSTTEANLIMVFEDKIVSEMREHTASSTATNQATDASLASSHPNETRAEFIKRCVQTASKHTLLPGEVPIRFVPLLPHSDFTSADLTSNELSLPASVTQVTNPGPARANPNKTGLSSTPPANSVASQALLDASLALNAIDLGQGFLNGKPVQTLSPTAPFAH